MTGTLKVRPGLSAPLVNSIPSTWDAQWFRRWITDFLNSEQVNTVTSIVAGTGIALSPVSGVGAVTISNTLPGVTSIIGTANQIAASSSTGNVTLSLPPNVQVASSTSAAAITAEQLVTTGSVNPAVNATNSVDSDLQLWVTPPGAAIPYALLAPSTATRIRFGKQVANTLEGFGPHAGTYVDFTADSGSYTATVTGFTTPPVITVTWARSGNFVAVFIPVIAAISNANTFGVSYPPGCPNATRQQFIAVPASQSIDNSTVNITDCSLSVQTAGGQFQFCRGSAFNGWTNVNLKGSGGFTFTFLLN